MTITGSAMDLGILLYGHRSLDNSFSDQPCPLAFTLRAYTPFPLAHRAFPGVHIHFLGQEFCIGMECQCMDTWYEYTVFKALHNTAATIEEEMALRGGDEDVVHEARFARFGS